MVEPIGVEVLQGKNLSSFSGFCWGLAFSEAALFETIPDVSYCNDIPARDRQEHAHGSCEEGLPSI